MNELTLQMPPTYSTGWIYILENEHMPGLLKIGFTRKTVEGRIRELSDHTGVPTAFICVFRRRVRNPEVVETAVHRALAACNVAKEFFRVDFELAVASVRDPAFKNLEPFEDEWRHDKHRSAAELRHAPSSLAPRKSESSNPAAYASVSTPIRRIYPTTAGQTTAQVHHKGKASISLIWVPLRGHENEM